jgi:hypothetical protein
MGRGVNMTDNVVHLHSKPRVTILPVLEDDFDTLLGIGMEFIAPAIARQSRDVTMQDVEDDIRGGGAVMWLVHVEDTLKAAITTCVVKHPQRNTLKIEFMGGTQMKKWMNEAIDTFADLARRADLGAVEADGRLGFDKYVDASPFREVYRHYVMELS